MLLREVLKNMFFSASMGSSAGPLPLFKVFLFILMNHTMRTREDCDHS